MRASRCEARRTYRRMPRRASLAGAPASAARATADTRRRWCNALCRELYPHFVCIFGTRRQTDMRTKGHWFPAPAGRVFRGRKICLRYFKIGRTYFEICALYFLFAPMWDKYTENQFSFFRTGKRLFKTKIFHSWIRNSSRIKNKSSRLTMEMETTLPLRPHGRAAACHDTQIRG